MIVSDVNEMHEIVRNNSALSWDGWVVVKSVQDDYAEYLASGFYNREDSRWYRRERYPLHEFGWEIPDGVISNEK
jgi:hypothetical protein